MVKPPSNISSVCNAGLCSETKHRASLSLGVPHACGTPGRIDCLLALPVVPLLPSHTCSQDTAHYIVALLFDRVYVLGHREARWQDHLDSQQLSVRLLGGSEEGCLTS